MIHQLQGGEAAPAKSAPEERTPERGAYREESRDERSPRSRDERPARREFSSERDNAPSRKPWRAAGNPVAARPLPSRREEGTSDRGARPVKPIAPAAPIAAEEKPTKTPPLEVPREEAKLPPGFPERREFKEPQPFRSPKASRRTPDEQTRLYMNLGEQMGVAAGDIVGAILGETGLPAKVVGTVDIRERHLFVDVASEHANAIIAKLNRTRIKNQKLKVKVA